MPKKNSKPQDKFADREAGKYLNPIVSREYILEQLANVDSAVSQDTLEKACHITKPDQKEALRRRLRAMVRDGQICRSKAGFRLLDEKTLQEGRVIGHRDGYGFVVLEHEPEDWFLNHREMRKVFDGDSVLVRLVGYDRKGRKEAAIVEVKDRAHAHVVGKFLRENDIGLVSPANKRISHDVLIPPGYEGSAKPGQIVVAELSAHPTARTQAIGRVTKILGDHRAPGMEVELAIQTHHLPHEWSDDAKAALKKIPNSVSSKDMKGRTDLRDLPLVTIDGEDAKDFDDAVYCERKKNGGWRLIVGIADVSHYVIPHSPLDKSALDRGNSVYFPDNVIPMLPEKLSNGLCSLKPKVDRLCLACDMQISESGDLTRYTFYPAVMHSKARLTYNEVHRYLTGEEVPTKRDHKVLLPHLTNLHEMYLMLRKAREKRGAIDFDTVETQIVFSDTRKIDKIIPRTRNDAHRLIEECMLMANDATARFLQKKKLPILFRVHKGPREEKVPDVLNFLSSVGLRLPKKGELTPADYGTIMRSIRGRPDENLIQTVLLRSMNQAVYTPENEGHFGLAYEAYTHFTSPIRRYPDLLVHRAIKHLLDGGKVKNFIYDKKYMVAMGEHASMTERRADEATRDAVQALKCEFMMDRVGQTFDGVITAVTGFGLFVELKNIYVEGLIHISGLKGDFYHFDSVHHKLCGERTGQAYRLGDPIQVRVVRVDLENQQIDFDLLDDKPHKAHNKQMKKPSPKKKAKAKSKSKTKRQNKKTTRKTKRR